MPNLNALAAEVYFGEVIPNPNATVPSLEIQPLAITNTPPAPGNIVVAQAPSGSVTGRASTWEYANSELAVTYYTTNLANGDNGIANPSPQANVTPGIAPNGPSVGLKADVQTTPAVVQGSGTTPGTPAMLASAIQNSIAGLPTGSLAVFNYGSSIGNI